VLDDFNRSDGAVGGNWSGAVGNYQISSSQLGVIGDSDLYWNANAFGANQEAFVTLSQVDPNASEIDVVRKASCISRFDSFPSSAIICSALTRMPRNEW
jgi:hypothetical protein